MVGLRRAALLLILGGVSIVSRPGPSYAQTVTAKEYQVKAAFLFRFLQFVEWPKSPPAGSEASICIGVLGQDPFGSALDEVVQNEVVQNRALVVRRASRVEDLRGCSLVFVSQSEKDRAAEILSSLGAAPTLTVSEVPGFARLGGIINFFLEGKKVRFEINPAAARQRGLKVSSELLSLGRIVESDSPRGSGPKGSRQP